MLSIPAKHCEPYNIAEVLNKFIKKQYPDDFEKFKADVVNLQQMRHAAGSIINYQIPLYLMLCLV